MNSLAYGVLNLENYPNAYKQNEEKLFFFSYKRNITRERWSRPLTVLRSQLLKSPLQLLNPCLSIPPDLDRRGLHTAIEDVYLFHLRLRTSSEFPSSPFYSSPHSASASPPRRRLFEGRAERPIPYP